MQGTRPFHETIVEDIETATQGLDPTNPGFYMHSISLLLGYCNQLGRTSVPEDKVERVMQAWVKTFAKISDRDFEMVAGAVKKAMAQHGQTITLAKT